MEFELWYLVLIPVLFAAGWWARGLEAREREENSRQLPEAYSRGVAMLMSDRPDKAIDPFIEVVRLEPELIELHHVLGILFRGR
ncbi:MAG: lipopolysaccharide assembly protein LapB, partial [Sutterella sp.]